MYCRCRPLLPFEEKRGDKAVIECTTGGGSVKVPGDSGDTGGMDGAASGRVPAKTYTYNNSFGPSASQEEVFSDTKDLVQSVFDGYNVCVFAFGQTGSGKTHTMYGDDNAPGIAPRTIDQLWDLAASGGGGGGGTGGGGAELTVYMAELYLDELCDLLRDPKAAPAGEKPPKLQVKKDVHGMVRLQGVTEVVVKSAAAAKELLAAGLGRRHVSGTAMNAQSSRSHLVFSVVVRQVRPGGKAAGT
eukprot:SAG22_NODE_1508_length_4264_cov_2.094838_2_plen_244_part_00